MLSVFDTCSGYGNDAIDLALALEGVGVDVIPHPLTIRPGLPRKFLRLLEKHPEDARPDVMLGFVPPHDLRPSLFPRDIPAVGYTMWERTPMLAREVTKNWQGEQFDPAHPLAHFDDLAVTCNMNAEALGPLWGPLQPRIIPCGVNAERFPVARRERSGPLRFLMVGALSHRKNPFAVLEAWRDVKAANPGLDATLHLHTTAPGLHPSLVDAYGPDLTLSQGVITPSELLDLYYDHDVMLCPSRGEGNNKPPMEFMCTGGFVIASDWSGHQNWLNPSLNWALPGTLAESPMMKETRDFEVDPAALRSAIIDACDNAASVRGMGEHAAAYMRTGFGWERTAHNILQVMEAAQ